MRRRRALFASHRPALSWVLGGLLCAGAKTQAAETRAPRRRDIAGSAVVAHGPRASSDASVEHETRIGYAERELRRRDEILRRVPVRDPAAVLALLDLEALALELPPARFETWLLGVGSNPRLHPLVRAEAHGLWARWIEPSDPFRARAFLADEGAVLDVLMMGPFDGRGGAGLHTPYPPETVAFSQEQRFRGQSGLELSWVRSTYESSPSGGFISFDERLRPNEHMVAYATTIVTIDRAAKAALHLGSGGPYKIWLDGELIATGGSHRHPHAFQDVHPILLSPGPHRLLFKVAVEEGAWGFHAHLRAAAGERLAGLRVDALADEPKRPPRVAPKEAGRSRTAQRAFPVESLFTSLRARAEGPDPTGMHRFAYAAYGSWVTALGQENRSLVDAAIAAEALLRDARAAELLARIDPDPQRSSAALERGLARVRANPSVGRDLHGRLLLARAERERAFGADERARQTLAEAVRVSPDDPSLEIETLEGLAEVGFVWSALARAEALAKRYPEATSVRLALAARLGEALQFERALAELERLGGAPNGPMPTRALGERAELLVSLGRSDEARALLESWVAKAPADPLRHRTVARTAIAWGDTTRALTSLREAVALVPHDVDLLADFGRLQARAGDPDGAIRSLRQALELRPQAPELRELLHSLEGSPRDAVFRRYALNLDTLRVPKTLPASWVGKEAAVLHQRHAARVLPNGLSERLDHRVIQVLDDRGARSQAQQSVTYDPTESLVEVRRARVRHADGTLAEVGETDYVPLTTGGDRMYFDAQAVRVTFAKLVPGDTIEVAFVVRDVAPRNKFDDYFGQIVPLAGALPVSQIDYILEAPSHRPLHFNVPVERTKLEDDAMTRYRHERRGQPALIAERGMPGWAEVAPYLHVSTYQHWDEVGRWYGALVRDQLVSDDRIRAAVHKVLGSLGPKATLAERTFALYEHVVRNTRYVGLEFGIHGFKPYRTTEVYERRFGDCKDKASLLQVMLAEAKIAANLVLVRTRDRGRLTSAPASLAAFNHVIVHVPELDLYLDGTAEWAGPHELPVLDQGASALVVEIGGLGRRDGTSDTRARFIELPESTALQNRSKRHRSVRLARDGGAQVQLDDTITGYEAASLREALHAETTRLERLQHLFGQAYPGSQVRQARVPTAGDILQPFTLHAELEVPRLARPEGTGKGERRLRVPALSHELDLVRKMAPDTVRRHDLVWPAAFSDHIAVEYVFPTGSRVLSAPKPGRVDTPYVLAELGVTSDGTKMRVELTLELRRRTVRAEDYAAFRAAIVAVDTLAAQSFAVEVP